MITLTKRDRVLLVGSVMPAFLHVDSDLLSPLEIARAQRLATWAADECEKVFTPETELFPELLEMAERMMNDDSP